MRALAIDFGERRIGLAVSDPSGTLARPLGIVAGDRNLEAAARAVLAALAEFERGDDPVDTIVVGLPKRLDGTPNDQTPRAEAFAAILARQCDRPVVLQDERLTSHDADQRLAAHDRDWRSRKARLDAAAAAVILQEFLDARRAPGAGGDPPADGGPDTPDAGNAAPR